MTSSAEAALARMISSAEFKKHCLRILDEVHGEPVTCTKRGITVGVVGPEPELKSRTFFLGTLEGSLLKYERPYDSAVRDEKIFAARGRWEPITC